MPWIIARRECETRIRDTFTDASRLLEQMLSLHSLHFVLQGEFFDIATNTRVREIADDRWSWPSEQYLWVRPENVSGGIDIEIDHIDESELDFIGSDMVARKVGEESYAAMMQRARDGVRYTLRLSFFQPGIMHLTLLALAAALATSSDGYLYTIDADWAAPLVPLSSGVLRRLLLNKRLRIRTGLQGDVEAVRRQHSRQPAWTINAMNPQIQDYCRARAFRSPRAICRWLFKPHLSARAFPAIPGPIVH
jgi:glutaredoxin-related protein